jgi:hypothetical protein
MSRRIFAPILATLVVLVVFAPAALASHKPGHQYPPGCENEPPPQAKDHKCWKHGFSSPPESKASLENLRQVLEISASEQAPGITLGMIMLAAAGTLTVVLTTQHRRRLQALRR